MRSSPRLRTFTLVATLAIVAASGCADNPEAVGVRLEKAKLVIENRSGTDVYYRVTGFRSEDFVPASLPGVRVRPGARLALDVDDPFVRDQGLAVHWWHEGDPLEGTDVRGADRVRKAVFSPRQVAAALPPLPDPEAARATGEVLLAACKERTLVGTWADRRARGLETASGPPDLRDEAVPAGCLALLRECTKLTRCDIVAVEQKDARDAMRAQVGYQPPGRGRHRRGRHRRRGRRSRRRRIGRTHGRAIAPRRSAGRPAAARRLPRTNAPRLVGPEDEPAARRENRAAGLLERADPLGLPRPRARLRSAGQLSRGARPGAAPARHPAPALRALVSGGAGAPPAGGLRGVRLRGSGHRARG